MTLRRVIQIVTDALYYARVHVEGSEHNCMHLYQYFERNVDAFIASWKVCAIMLMCVHALSGDVQT